jgi:hypothetical protein
MSAAFATAALPNRPDPSPDPAAAPAPPPSRTGRLLGLLRKLIDYGLELACSLQQNPAVAALIIVARHFGTRDIALILSRITRGLQLAGELEAKLVRRPLPEVVAQDLFRIPVDRAPCSARRSAPRPGLPDVPTAADIAAALRDRPAGDVIADICRDLGIVPSHPLWGEIWMVVTEFGGNVMRLYKNMTDRLCAGFTDPSLLKDDRWAEQYAPAAAVGATGPP